MRAHLINVDSFGIWDDDYEKFFAMRCNAIARELRKRVIPQDVDRLNQQINVDDLEESELAA